MYYGKTNKSFAVTNILANSSESNQFPSSINRVNMNWISSKYIWCKQELVFILFNIYLKSSTKVLPPDKLAVKLPHVSFLMDHHEPSSYLNLSVVITISTTTTGFRGESNHTQNRLKMGFFLILTPPCGAKQPSKGPS